jgi:hypothetical protein
MTYRSDLDALAARRQALTDEVTVKQKELAEATRLHEDATRHAKLPVLDNLRVAAPCPKKWEEMTGDERSRHCDDCNKSVYNISGLTRDEAQALLIEKEGRLCVRYFQRKDGTILLKDCTIGVSKRRKRRIFAAGAAALLSTGAAGLAYKLFGTEEVLGGHIEEIEEEVYETAGMPMITNEPLESIAGGISPPPIEMLGEVSVEPEVLKPKPPHAQAPKAPLNLSLDSPARR